MSQRLLTIPRELYDAIAKRAEEVGGVGGGMFFDTEVGKPLCVWDILEDIGRRDEAANKNLFPHASAIDVAFLRVVARKGLTTVNGRLSGYGRVPWPELAEELDLTILEEAERSDG